MTPDPVVIAPEEHLAEARARMIRGRFRRLPVVHDGRLVGIITDRDVRQHLGFLERTKVNAVMTENLITVKPQSTLEEAAQLLLKHKIGGLPVVEEQRLVGIITTSDILRAFLQVMGASEEGTTRVDLLLEGEGHDLTTASATVAEQGGEVLGLGTYREKWGENPVCYLRLHGVDPERAVEALAEKGFTVLGVHP
jgi:acetoin utilization protein AcuB